jgi:hypothetical protein
MGNVNNCYVGCSPPSSIVGHAPVIHSSLAFTGANFHGLEFGGVICILVGLFLVADRKLRNYREKF